MARACPASRQQRRPAPDARLGRDHAVRRNPFAVGLVVIGDCEDECRAVIELDELLHGSNTIAAIAYCFAAMIIGDGAGHDFGRAGGGVADQHGDRLLPGHFRGDRRWKRWEKPSGL